MWSVVRISGMGERGRGAYAVGSQCSSGEIWGCVGIYKGRQSSAPAEV